MKDLGIVEVEEEGTTDRLLSLWRTPAQLLGFPPRNLGDLQDRPPDHALGVCGGRCKSDLTFNKSMSTGYLMSMFLRLVVEKLA